MNLAELRKLFISTSGRYDLINDDGTDNGADNYLRLGQLHLETKHYWDKAEAVSYTTLVQAFAFTIPRARVINSVWAADAVTCKMTPLNRITLAQAREFVLSDYSDYQGSPLFYTLYNGRGMVDASLKEDIFSDPATTDYVDGQNYGSIGVILSPTNFPAGTLVEFRGLFREPLLTLDTDVNYWSSTMYNLMVYAAMRELEVMHRNRQGVADWDTAIMSALFELEKDSVMSDISYSNCEMQG